jgi:dipeptidyl aminopeptidase/acylaminoacyl peptidase
MMFRSTPCLCLTGCALIVAVGSTGSAQAPSTAAPSTLSLEAVARNWNSWAGTPPDEMRWAPDGATIHFLWNPERHNVPALYAVRPVGGVPVRLQPEAERNVPPWERGRFGRYEIDPSRTANLVVYERQGDIFLHDVKAGTVKRITNTDLPETSPRFSHDGTLVTFESNNNLFSYALASGEVTQLTNFRVGRDSAPPARTEQQQFLEAQQLELFTALRRAEEVGRAQRERTSQITGPRVAPTFLTSLQRVTDMQLAPDGRAVTFTLVDEARSANDTTILLPDFVTRSGYVEIIKAPPGAVKAREAVTDFRLGVVGLPQGTVRYVDAKPFGKPVNWNPVVWSADGRRAITWIGSQDHKDLWLGLVEVGTAAVKVLYTEHDPAFVRDFRGGRVENEAALAFGFMPDGRSVFFQSERDGWYHLYAVSLDGGEPTPLTTGRCDVENPVLASDKASWYFLSCDGDPLERHVYRMPLAGGPRTRLTPLNAWCADYALSPDHAQIAFILDRPAAPPELFAVATQGPAEPKQLTSSTTDEFRRFPWPTPEYVTFPDKDGTPVYGELYKPSRPHPLKPALIHVHGSGWMQGVAKKFSPYTPESRAEFQFYAEQGYTVLNVDYKGSKGYGRAGRVALYRDALRPPVDSLLAAVDFLVAKHRVDRARIGLYGHSFGGSVTMAAQFSHPGVFRAVAAHSAQADMAHSQPYNFINRYLNVPWQDREAYRRSSPIYIADQFQDRLLLLAGVLDRPVSFQSTLRLVQRLIELGKTGWDLAVYPVEGHGVREPSSMLDLQRRRFSFFESVLKAPQAPVRAPGAGGR